MTPEQFLAAIRKKSFAPAYLFLGAEAFGRDRCRAALIEAVLSPEEREHGLTRHDLAEVPLRDAIDDARSLSLFASNRVILLSGAEALLPRGRAAESEDDEDGGGSAAAAGAKPLEEYFKDPSPGVVLVVEAVRYGFEGEEKKKLERVAKFYSSVPAAVEFKRYSVDEAAAEAAALAKRAGLSIDRVALDLLVESLGADVARIAVEIEKLSLYASNTGGAIGTGEISALVPDARATTVFALVNALGRKDRKRALAILDTLVREGEYLPLALAFLSTQFRMALIAREAGLRGASQIQAHFSKAGVPMWGSRAEQIYQTLTKFYLHQLELGLKLIFQADRDLRGARPDDRIVIENFIWKLTA